MSATNNENIAPDSATRARRSSVSSNTFGGIFGRSNSTAGAPTTPYPGPITAAAQDQRRRMSIATIGLTGTSPSQNSPFGFGARRGSASTDRSDSVDENAIDDDDGPGRSNPPTPFSRRVSFGAQILRSRNPNTSSGSNGRSPSYSTTAAPSLYTIPSGSRNGGATPPKAQASTQSKPRTASDFPSPVRSGESGFNWPEQLRTRAESSVSQSQRPSFSSFNTMKPAQSHERAKSATEMPAPPTQVPLAQAKPARPIPDAFQERILKGDFYMD